MNKSQMIDKLAEQTGYNAKVTDKVVRVFFDSIKEALATGDKVEIRGFGSFSLKHYESYHGRNPRTGETVLVSPKRLPVFRTGKDLRLRVDKSREQGVALIGHRRDGQKSVAKPVKVAEKRGRPRKNAKK
jgi:integration host factor subunit beta